MKLNVIIIAVLMIFNAKTTAFAQKIVETVYFNALHDTVKTKAEAHYYRIIQTNGKRRITTKYDSTDLKLQETTYLKDKPKSGEGDSIWWRYGSFREWYPSGQLKEEGSHVFDRFHDNLKTYYPNGVMRRNDIYHMDSLKSGHCYAQDSTEITYFPYQEKPEFIGGLKGMFQFIAENITYPRKIFRNNSAEGTVHVGFVVSKTGEVENVKIKRSVNKLLDEEAMRVVKLMPKWKPGKQEGEFVRVSYTLPVKFRLQ